MTFWQERKHIRAIPWLASSNGNTLPAGILMPLPPRLQSIRSSLTEFWRFLRSTPPVANWIGFVTTAAWFVKAIWLDHLPELFPGANDVGRVVEGLFSALVAGYVFYLLFALWPDYQARRRLAPFLSSKMRGVVGDCLAILHEVERLTGRPLPLRSVTDANITDAFAAVPTGATPNMTFFNGSQHVPASWFIYLNNQRCRTQEFISSLYQQNRFLDVDLVRTLTNIENCTFLMLTKSLETTARSRIPFDHPPITFWT